MFAGRRGQRGRQKVDVNRHVEFERRDLDVAGRNRDPATDFTVSIPNSPCWSMDFDNRLDARKLLWAAESDLYA